MNLKQKSMFRNYSSFIQNISVFTKDFKNQKTYFEPLISGKIIFWTIQVNFKTFHDICLGFCFVCWFHFSSGFFHLGKCQRHEHFLDYTYSYFSKQEVSRRQVVHDSSSKSECSCNDFFSMYFIWNTEEIHFLLKIVKNNRHKL